MIHATSVRGEVFHLPTIPPMIPPAIPPTEMPMGQAMIYIRKAPVWEYKQIVRNLEKQEMLSEAELNQLGAEGWELAGVIADAMRAVFYFKRAVD